jgi:hypothetical protein
MDHAPISIVATLNLSDETERKACEVIRRMHTGECSLFRRMHDLRRDGSDLIELAEWQDGGFAIVRWNMTTGELGLRWQDFASLQAARQAFLTSP